MRLDEDGKPIELERIENDESHQLIEEFMLAANEAVASELKNRWFPTIYRVHENPDPEKLAEYRELVLSYNYKIGDLTQRRNSNVCSLLGKAGRTGFESRAAQKPEAGALRHSRSDIMAWPRAIPAFYQPDPPLCRSGCPSRLAERDQKRCTRRMGQLASIAEHISDTERNAAEAEIDAVRMKKLEFFERQWTRKIRKFFERPLSMFGIMDYCRITRRTFDRSGACFVPGGRFLFVRGAQRRLIGRRSRRSFPWATSFVSLSRGSIYSSARSTLR